MNKIRLFIAINLPDNVKAKLLNWQHKTEGKLIACGADERQINWVRRDNLHITLVFIGYATNDKTYEICNVVRSTVKRHEPFYINLERIIVGPPNATPRMFWVEGEKSQELADLQNDLENALAGGNLAKKEIRAFRPHITLARFKYPIVKLLPEKIDEPFKYQIPVETIEVMQSILKKEAAQNIRF